MKTMIKFAAISAAALAVSSTAALALPELPAGTTTGLALGAPLPEGVYDISIASYGSAKDSPNSVNNVSYAIPVWLIWSTPYQIAGGRIALDTATAIIDAGNSTSAHDSFGNTLVEGSIAWNLNNGFNASLRAGAWLPSTQEVPTLLSRDFTAFMGGGSISYVAGGWNLTATALYGSGHDMQAGSLGVAQNSWVNLDLTATKKLGKMEIGVIAYGTWDVDSYKTGLTTKQAKAEEFAIGGLVGYDFGSFIAQAKLAGDVEAKNIIGRNDDKEVRGTLTIIKPLWSPASEGPLK
jgi:hypothetical protein